MNAVLRRGVVVVGVGAGVVAVRRITARQRGDGAARRAGGDRWHTLTINRSPEEVAPGGRLSGPLAEFSDAVEVKVRPAPGDRGTEVAARVLRNGSVQRLREALRQTRQLAETGEVLSPDKPPTTRRTPTGIPLELVTRRARGEGRL
jgi:hypothetical protein